MKKLSILGLLLFLGVTALQANVNAVVSILPQQTFLKAIGGDKVNISLMVKPGNSPHTYEPKPSQMKDISKADIYFAIGVEFEHVWLDRFKNQNSNMKVVNISKGIIREAMASHSHKHHDDEHHDNYEKKHKKTKKDPHVWTSPNNVKQIVQNIYNELVVIDKENKAYYKSNLEKYLNYIDNTDNEIKAILKDVPRDTKFMVFHPAWGYFAHQYHLTQLPIEIEGKSPKPKALAYIIKEAKEENVKAVFTQPEFSDKIAKTIANQLNIKVIKTSPLSPKWKQNLLKLAKAIANK
ncbi:MAG: zinc ABC transporter substrate-binding protein [Campylobacterota bacterium]|nr:zinc ABC transporter substrate-binding protein [Campylobacterota bacterium]